MKTKNKIIGLSIIAVIALAVTISSYAYAFSEIKGLQIELQTPDTSEVSPSVPVSKYSVETSNFAENPQETAVSEPKRVVNPQPAKQTPVEPTPVVQPETYQGAHIPFTSEPVTPGNPDSYVDTVGQCPFYEMAGEKGCYPPSDIECNADWSVCTPKVKTDDN